VSVEVDRCAKILAEIFFLGGYLCKSTSVGNETVHFVISCFSVRILQIRVISVFVIFYLVLHLFNRVWPNLN